MAEDAPALVLGSAQWGGEYGVANSSGPPSEDELVRLLELAKSLDVCMIDTARVYGNAEERIGRAMRRIPDPGAFRIITKVAPSAGSESLTPADAERNTEASLRASLAALAPSRPTTVLLHRGEHRRAAGGALWSVLCRAKANGTTDRIGVSAADPLEAMDAVKDPEIDVIQVASSLLDRRLLHAGFFELAEQFGKEIHVRSVYLQGLAFLTRGQLAPRFAAAAPSLAQIREVARRHGVPPSRLWLDYARSLPVQALVIGCERSEQLAENVDSFSRPVCPGVRGLVEELPSLSEDVLDPSRWRRDGGTG